MTWVLTIVGVWLALALTLGIMVGRGIRMAERRRHLADSVPDFIPAQIVLQSLGTLPAPRYPRS
jgi:hypothetical protein